MIHAYASQPHYIDHLAPIWRALPPDQRGTFFVAPGRHSGLRRAQRLLPNVKPGLPLLRQDDHPTLVAGWADSQRLRKRPLILLEHGAGQHYGGGREPRDLSAAQRPEYSGGARREGVALFLSPSETVAARNAEVYPEAAHAVVGCPKLDRWHVGYEKRRGSPPVVAVAFHWNCTIVPEARWALPHYAELLPRLASRFELIGHGHPRARKALESVYARHRIRYEPDLEVVFSEADLLVCDNSSALYEFASLDRPCVVLNAPWYRRDVEHGLRFWSAIPGEQVDEPEEVEEAIVRGLASDPMAKERRRAVRDTYVATDGKATLRAVAAIQDSFGC